MPTPAFCIVTGAASGIGQATATHLRAQGHDVLGIDRTADPANGIAALDLARPDAGDALLNLTAGRDPDALVNVAAVFHNGPLSDTDAAAWDRLYAVNLRAPALLARALAPGLARRKGTIVNVSSINGQINAPATLPMTASRPRSTTSPAASPSTSTPPESASTPSHPAAPSRPA